MSSNPRETETELLTEVRKYLGTPEIILIRKWMGTLLEGAKDNLVDCDPDKLREVQAEARVYKNILRKLDRAAYKQDQYLKQQLQK
jgi:ABC-type Zn uptake system ZnuABC Zn-binding protein ZnuA